MLDLESLRKRHYRMVVDYGHGASVNVMSPIFNEIGADVIALNATRDPARYSRTGEEFDRDIQVLGLHHGHAQADLGVRIDTAGERIYVVDDRGRPARWRSSLLAAMTELMLRQRARRRGRGAGHRAQRGRDGGRAAQKGKIVYTKVMPQALTSAAVATVS